MKKIKVGKKEYNQEYRVIESTDPYNAARNIHYKRGECTRVLAEGLTLKEAQKKLVEYWNDDNENGRGMYLCNWGLIRINDRNAYSHADGTRGYDYDCYRVRIEEKYTGNYMMMPDGAEAPEVNY